MSSYRSNYVPWKTSLSTNYSPTSKTDTSKSKYDTASSISRPSSRAEKPETEKTGSTTKLNTSGISYRPTSASSYSNLRDRSSSRGPDKYGVSDTKDKYSSQEKLSSSSLRDKYSSSSGTYPGRSDLTSRLKSAVDKIGTTPPVSYRSVSRTGNRSRDPSPASRDDKSDINNYRLYPRSYTRSTSREPEPSTGKYTSGLSSRAGSVSREDLNSITSRYATPGRVSRLDTLEPSPRDELSSSRLRSTSRQTRDDTSSNLPRYTSSRNASKEDLSSSSSSKYINSRFLPKNTIEKSYTAYSKPTSSSRTNSSIEDNRRSRDNLLVVLQTQKSIANSAALKSPKQETPSIKSPTPVKSTSVTPVPVKSPQPPRKQSSDEESTEEESSTEEEEMETVTIITRGTSPTPPSQTTTVRTRRSEARILQKDITRLKKRNLSNMVDKEMQSDRMDDTARYSRFGSSSSVSAAPWSSYLDLKYNSPRSSNLTSPNTSHCSNCSSKVQDTKDNSKSDKSKTDTPSKENSTSIETSLSEKTSSKKVEKPVSKIAKKSSSSSSESINSLSRNNSAKSIKSESKVKSLSKSRSSSTASENKYSSAMGTKSTTPLETSSSKKPPTSLETSTNSSKKISPQTSIESSNSSKKISPQTSIESSSSRKISPQTSIETSSSKKQLPPPVPKSESPAKVIPTGVPNKDFRKSVLNMNTDGKSIKKSFKRSSSASSDSEPSSVATNTDSQIQDLPSLSKSVSQSLPKVKSSSSISSSKLPQRVSPSPPRVDKDIQRTRRSPSACSESSNSSVSSSEDDGKKAAKKTIKSAGSSRTSMLISSADDLSAEKSSKPPPSPRTKTEIPRNEAEAKSFLMRALAPVTNFFKLKQQECEAENINWMESGQVLTEKEDNSINKKLESSMQSSDKSSGSGSKIKFKLDKPDPGEEPWWMSDNPEIPEGVQIIANNEANGELEVKEGKHVYKIRRNESGKVEWWLDSSEDSANKNQFKLRHQDSGEKAWWLMSQPNIPEGITNFEESSSDEDVDKPLGDRASPEGLEMPASGRLSPYDNVPSTNVSNQNKSPRPGQLPMFISKHRNIDEILGGSNQLLSPLMDRIFSLQGDCEEIDPGQVRIHDSTAQRPVIQPNRIDRDVIKGCSSTISGEKLGSMSVTCRVQFLNDVDPFAYVSAFPEPARPPLHTFSAALPLINQLAAVHRVLQAPHRLDDAALQLYKDGDYGSYLDLEASISEQQEEFEGFQSSKKNSIVLRTQLSVRVHTIIEKLLTSEGRELRRALFSLKQIFQEDKDLVHEFVQNDGLACLIKVGSEADQNYQNYILRALGQVMLYVDGMNGVMEHNQTVQWLYTLIASKFRLVVKTALKLLLVFVEYVDSNCMLLIKAVNMVDGTQGLLAWSNIMRLLKDFNSADTELLIYAMTLINKCLNGIPDQDTYYDQVDALEEQGMEAVIQRYMSKQGTDLDLLQQFQIYEAVLQHEDGEDKSMPLRHLDESIRKTLRSRKSVLDNSERRKSRRHSTGNTPTTIQTANKLKFYSLQTSTVDDEDESSSSQSSGHNDHNLNGSYKDNNKANDAGVTPALRRRRERAERQRSFIREQQESAAILRASLGIAEDNENGNYTNSLQQRMSNGNLQLTRNCSRKDLTPLMNAVNKLMYGKPADENSQINEEDSENTNENDRKMLLQLKRENTVKDLTQKLSSQNIIHNNTEDNQKIRIGDMCGLISKAKEGLAKSKSKGDIMKSPTMENIPKAEIKKSENELRWEELVNAMNRPLNLCDMDFTDLQSDDEADILAPIASSNGIPPPPPPLCKDSGGPPPPPIGARNPPPPFPSGPCFGVTLQRPQRLCQEQSNKNNNGTNGASNTIKKNKKTVKLFWKEVRDDPIALTKLQKFGGMIWDELSPVNIDTQKLEHLFESRAKDLISKKQQEMNKNKEIIVLDHKRSNAINIGMTKLPPPRSIKTAILKMDATIMNREGIEKLLTMLPTEEERTKIQEAQTSNPDLPLGSAEQFLLTLASISELPARLKLWAFKLDFENLEREIAEPLMDLKQGIELLKCNKTFRGILSTLLSIGIFLNGAEVKGFQIEYLAKVPEVKDTVHKHSLLHHLCHIVMEKFPEASDLYSEIGAITRASKIDFDELALNIQKLESDCKSSWDHLKLIAKHDGSTMMKVKMSDFLADCAERIIILSIIHRRVMNRYHKFLLWLGIPLHRIADSKPNEFCRVVSEFALEYRTTRERVLQQIEKKANHRERNKTRGKMITEVGKFRTKEDRADAELRQLLGSDISDVESMQGTLPWRRTRRDPHSGGALTPHNGNLTDDGDDEILETLVKTATKAPASRATPRERKRTRHADRKSLRRTLKNGLSEEEKKHIAAFIKGY